MALTILSCGPGTSLQDKGRFGLQRNGAGSSGAFNQDDLRAVNALVGNGEEAAIEFLMLGGSFKYNGEPRLIALAGDATLHVNDALIPPLQSVIINEGTIIKVGVARTGNSMMLGVSGGFDLPLDLGSLSFHLRAGLGVKVIAGETLPLKPAKAGETCALSPFQDETGALRVILGPQDDYFMKEMIDLFLISPYTITQEADRMGYRLTGAKLTSHLGHNIISDGIVTGSIQVPGNGEPIILMADRQTTGGYPKIATILSCDIARLSKKRSGEQLTFKAVTQVQGIEITRKREQAFTSWLKSKSALKRELTSEFLLSLNLSDGFVKA
jgi:5-oxoprolinase (ATP-hydrolysing) subunit C